MADVKWIKILTDVFDDEKILLIDALPERDGIIVIWFKMLCLAGRQNNGGVLMLNDRIAYTDEMLSTIFRRPLATVRLALSTFESFGMIEIVNNTITIPNWDKHQSLDKLEQAKEKNRRRVAKHREKQKQLAGGNAQCNVTSNADVMPCNATEEEKEKDLEKDLEKEVEAVKGAGAPDYDDPDNKLQFFKGGVKLTEKQVADLLEKMDVPIFNHYIEKAAEYPNIKNYYQTILKWYDEDRAVVS